MFVGLSAPGVVSPKMLMSMAPKPIVFALANPDPEIGYDGLLTGRRAVTAYSSQVFAPGVPPAFGTDFQSTFLRSWLQFCGIDEIHELRLQPSFPTPDLEARRTTVLELVMMISVSLALVVFGIWFFFFAHASLPGG